MMTFFSFSGILVFAVLAVIYLTNQKKSSELEVKGSNYAIFIIMAIGLIFRILIAPSIKGYGADIGVFSWWSDTLFSKGTFNFYSSATAAKVVADYPPGYMYVLYIVGALKSLFHLSNDGTGYNILLKLPAMLADVASGYVLYRFAISKTGHKQALLISALYIFNPLVYLDSSWWGQVDSVFALALLVTFILLYNDRPVLSAVMFAVAVLIKPQAITLFPVFIWYVIDLFIQKNPKAIKITLISIGAGLGTFILLILPFSNNLNLMWIVDLYKKTLASYPYASLNASGLFSLLGGNAQPVDSKFLFLTYNKWSTIFIVILTLVSGLIYFKKREGKIFYTGSFLVIAMYVLAAKMHERYLFPAIILLLAYYIVTNKKTGMLLFGIFSFTLYFNIAYMLSNALAQKPVFYLDQHDPLFLILSLINVLSLSYMIYYWFKSDKVVIEAPKIKQNAPLKQVLKPIQIKDIKPVQKQNKPLLATFEAVPSQKRVKYTKIDALLLAILILGYSALAFVNLGDTKAPQTFWKHDGGDSVIVDLGSVKNVERLNYFQGQTVTRFKFSTSVDGQTWVAGNESENSSVFYWVTAGINISARYIKILTIKNGNPAYMHEIGVYEQNTKALLPIVSINDNRNNVVKELYDEQNTAVYQATLQNGTYFDEIYHARTAYENIHQLEVSETSHPPLGKVIMALGIKLFGMTPFGWRFMGTLFGIFMIPAMYMLGKQIFKRTIFGFIPAFLITFDFMHFTQTRIATIDSYAVFFIILMYYFMYRFYESNYNTDNIKDVLKPLLWSGIFFGIGSACKWIDLYSGIGLSILFLIAIIKRIIEYNRALLPKFNNDKTALSIRKSFGKNTVTILLWSVVFFGIIPLCIYTLAYIPFIFINGHSYTIKEVINYQKSMFSYHSNLKATHPYSSNWYEWPIMKRPMWYYNGAAKAPGNISTISAFGNPAIWWTGILASAAMMLIGIKRGLQCFVEGTTKYFKSENIILFLFIAYMSQYVPWMQVSRIVFIYHYFASIPFVILIITNMFYWFYTKCENKKAFMITLGTYLGIVAILFIMFYPVISGAEVSKTYVQKWLVWFSSWVFTTG